MVYYTYSPPLQNMVSKFLEWYASLQWIGATGLILCNAIQQAPFAHQVLSHHHAHINEKVSNLVLEQDPTQRLVMYPKAWRHTHRRALPAQLTPSAAAHP